MKFCFEAVTRMMSFPKMVAVWNSTERAKADVCSAWRRCS
jgi:hypothetical protein